MRLYHTILLLSALIITINATFQAVWVYQFSQVRESVSEFGSNWLPTIRLTGELARLTGEFRRMELLYVLARSDAEISHLARRLSRQEGRIKQSEEKLQALMFSESEQQAFSGYLDRKAQYIGENKAILRMMFESRPQEAMALAKSSATTFGSMYQDLLVIERLNQDFGLAAMEEANQHYVEVVRGMLAAGVASVVVALGAAVLTARRISRPIASLAQCMEGEDSVLLSSSLPEPPVQAVKEVSILYQAFKTLTAKLARSMERLEAQAVTDQLTGVSNRRRLMEEGAKVLDICRRGFRPCSALMLDLDHFKSVNDTYGHATGDAVLMHTAQTLLAHIRGSDLLSRYGGEEFVLLAPNSGLQETYVLAERLRRSIEESFLDAQGTELRVTVSIGVAADGPHVRDLAGLIDLADKALYTAKQNGRNRVESCETPT